MICRLAPTFIILALTLAAQTTRAFDSGSNGSYGAMNISADTTLDLPPDGIFHCTTITVAAGATLRFRPNALNTPVYLLAKGDVVINGTINVSGEAPDGILGGRGGPGGFAGGRGGAGIEPMEPGDGHGPGGGRRIEAGIGNASPLMTATFGTRPNHFGRGSGPPTYGSSLLVPLIGGSGSAGTSWPGHASLGGAGGGGAICLASGTKVSVLGSVLSNGGNNPLPFWRDLFAASTGSGGAIRVIVPLVDGTGTLSVAGGLTGEGERYELAGRGRIRVDSEERILYRYLIYVGPATHGSQMFVFPDRIPKLNVVEAAGRSISGGETGSVRIDLPTGSPSTQRIKIEAKDFTNAVVTLDIVVTPENGPSTTYPAEIKTSDSPPQVSMDVAIPPGIPTRIFAWTRPNL